MQALFCNRPGEFAYKDIPKPELIPGHAIIKVKRIGICGTDLHAFEGTQPYFDYPRILGHEISGELVDFDNAPGFNNGEAVTFIPYLNCGQCIACRNGKPNCCCDLKVCGVHIDGGMQEYFRVPSSSLIHGSDLGYEALALVEPLAIAAHGVRRAGVSNENFVLVIGAGPIGMGTMEMARLNGGKVIALDVNEKRLQHCKDVLKIEHCINPLKDHVVESLMHFTNGEMPTVVIDASGNKQAIERGLEYLANGGVYVLIGLQKDFFCFSHPEFHKREATLMSSRNATRHDFERVINSLKKGEILPASYITDRVSFHDLTNNFSKWLDTSTGTIKAMVEMW